MNFIDKTGHIFSIASYDVDPIGYEYEEHPYVFWLDDEYTGKLSIDNWYMKPIRCYIENDSVEDISVLCESSIFKLISPKEVQTQISKTGQFEIDEGDASQFKSELTKDDIIIIRDGDETVIPFYVIGLSKEATTWLTNVKIYVKLKSGEETWTPITVGGVFYDECEPLIINGQNYGVTIPKDALRAVYQQSFYHDSFNATLFNDKVKEYLLNFMQLRGECGNLNSALCAIKWFGWGDKINIYRLYKNDNDAMSQFMRDTISIVADNILAYKNFKSTSYLGLEVKENVESGEENEFDFSDDFFGENKPIMTDLFQKLVEVRYDEGDIIYYKGYYDYAFEELSLKLACLSYFYKNMFLPIHAALKSASINHNVFINDIKFVTEPFNKIVEVPQLLVDSRHIEVEFPDTHHLYFSTNVRYVDDNFNEFTNYKHIGETTESNIYYTDNIGFEIPIKFHSSDERFYDVVFLLRKEDKLVFESHFSFCEEDESNIYKQLVIIPQLLNGKFNINYWEGKHYILDVFVNGKWFTYSFDLHMPELHTKFGKLEYEYTDAFRQIRSIDGDNIDFYSYMHLPSLVDVNNIRFPREVIDYTNKGELLKFISQYRDVHNINDSSKYYNKVHFYRLKDYMTNEDVAYDGTNDINLYKHFFNNDGSLKQSWKNAFQNESSPITYDLYIMHDDDNIESYKGILSEDELVDFKPCWYAVLISRETIDHKISTIDDVAPEFPNEKTYIIEYTVSDEKFLINRMKYVPSNGYNRFNHDDIIVGSISNADTPFIMSLGTKWNINPFSIKMNDDAEVESNSNMFIMGLGKSNYIYESGYYDITVRYSLDGFTQHQCRTKTRIFVD